MKEQILIVHLGFGFEEACHPCSKDRYEYSYVELLEHFVNVCLPYTKKKRQWNIRACHSFQHWGRSRVILIHINRNKQKITTNLD